MLEQKIKQHLNMLRVLNNQFTKKVVEYCKENANTTVTAVQIALKMEQAVVSKSLSDLRKYGFVETKRDGKYIRYSMSPKYQTTIDKIVAI